MERKTISDRIDAGDSPVIVFPDTEEYQKAKDKALELHSLEMLTLEKRLQYKHNLEQAILDCWNLIEPKPRTKPVWLSTRLRNEELVENQEELITSLREILEPIVDKIKENENV